ncbi:hypothetical protein [Candidatus Enterovibrio escicola]
MKCCNHFDRNNLTYNIIARTIITDNRWELLLQLMKRTGRVYDKPE